MEVTLQASDAATNAQRWNSGLDSGGTIVGIMAEILTGNGKINGKLLTAIVKNFGPFLGALGPCAAIIGTFSDSPEVQLLNQVLGTINKGFERIENKLEVIGHAIDEIHKKIDRTRFENYIQVYGRDPIVVLKAKVDLLLYKQPKLEDGKVDVASLQKFRDQLMKDSESGIGDVNRAWGALTKLYKIFKGEMPDSRTSLPWCATVRTYSNDHRHEVISLSIEYFKIWLTGAQSYLFTLELTKDTRHGSETRRLRQEAEEIMTEIGQCEQRIIDNWTNRWTIDVTNWAQKGGVNAARQIANAIYQGAIDKYYWRDWLVVVYSKDNDYTHKKCMQDEYTTDPPVTARLVNKCDSYKDLSYHKDHASSWTVHVLSVAAEKEKIPNLPDISYVKCGEPAEYRFWNYPSCVGGNGHSGNSEEWYFNPYDSTTIYNKFPSIVKDNKCTKFVSSGVVRATQFAARGKGDRMKSFRRGPTYRLTNSNGLSASWDGIYINGWYFG